MLKIYVMVVCATMSVYVYWCELLETEKKPLKPEMPMSLMSSTAPQINELLTLINVFFCRHRSQDKQVWLFL